MRKIFQPLLLAIALTSNPLFAQDQSPPTAKHRELINSGGGKITLGKSVPGRIKLTGDKAFTLLSDANASTIAAAGFAGKGRVIAFSHGSFLTGGFLEQKPAADLTLNAFRWAAQSKQVKVGLPPSLKKMATWLEKQGVTVHIIPANQLAKNSKKIDAYAIIGHNVGDDINIKAIQQFVTNGGGLLTATTPWAFSKKYPDYATFPGNQITEAAGLAYLPNGYASKGPIVVNPKTPGSNAIAAARNSAKNIKPSIPPREFN